MNTNNKKIKESFTPGISLLSWLFPGVFSKESLWDRIKNSQISQLSSVCSLCLSCLLVTMIFIKIIGIFF